MADPKHCADLVRASDRDRFLASLFAPATLRPAILSLYAFDIEIARIAHAVREPMAGEVRLQWWYDVVAGPGREQAAGSPVAAALIETLAAFNLPVEPLLALIEAHRHDLYREPLAVSADLERYAQDVAAPIFNFTARILGADVGAVLDPLSLHAGAARTITRLLVHFPRDLAEGCFFLPLDMLQQHDVNIDDVTAGKNPPALMTVRAHIRDMAMDHLIQARDLLKNIPERAHAAFLPLALIRPVLERMSRQADDPFAAVSLPAWRRQSILWRAARNLPAAL